MRYAIQIKVDGSDYLLCEEGKETFELFDTYEEADDFNYDFEQSLEEGSTSAVVEFN